MYIMGHEEVEAVRKVLESGQLFRYRGGEGGEADRFEAEWAGKIGVRRALAVTSGTAALTCALAGMGIGPGDEVIVPAYTWMATPIAALSLGAIPRIAEVDESLTLDPVDVERLINARTKVIIPVHMCGFPCDMRGLQALAAKHGLRVLEDACQADGGSYQGRRLGSIGDAGTHSFNHFKIISCGEGGAVVTSDETIYRGALVYHDIGSPFREYADCPDGEMPCFAGTNYRMNEVLCAILRVQVTRLDGILGALRREHRILREELAGKDRFRLRPMHDEAGDCGTTLGLFFESSWDARAFQAAAKDCGVVLNSPIDSGIHVYTNWKTIIEKRGAHHPGCDPYKACGYEVVYTEDMCPRTLDYLARTLYVATAVDREEPELRCMIDGLKRAAGRPG